MNLNAQIRQTMQTLRETLPLELSAMIEQGAGEISALEIVERAKKTGDDAPDFTLKNQKGEERTLSDYLIHGNVVLTFYRGNWCPYCNLQLAAYNARLDEIKAVGGCLVAVSPETPQAQEALLASDLPTEAKDTVIKNQDFDVLQDTDNVLAKQFGLVFELPDAHKKLLEVLKFDVEKANGNDSYAFPDPATYIIGKDGKIAWAFVPNNYRKRAEADDIIKALKSI